MKILFVCGDWNDEGGRASGYMRKLARAVQSWHPSSTTIFVQYIEGGRFDYLLNNILPEVADADLVYWFCHTDSDKPMLVELVKKVNPKAILVMLGKNDKTVYAHIAKMLTVKANLMVEICPKSKPFTVNLLDPLGNCFLFGESDINKVAEALATRAKELFYLVRLPSVSIGRKVQAPDMPEFFALAREHAKTFHDLIHMDKQDRYLGHLSFRCENGFPSFRDGNFIFVSKRNIDKRTINADSFVALNPNCTKMVEYYGDEKPSVDAPISLRLYGYYDKINYMLHSHMYVKNAPFTEAINPCGVVAEVYNIVHVLPDIRCLNAIINLKGHGSLVMASDLNYLKNIEYIKRDMPEIIGEK